MKTNRDHGSALSHFIPHPTRGLRTGAAADKPAVALVVGAADIGVRARAALLGLAAPCVAAHPTELLGVLRRHRVGAVMIDCEIIEGGTEALIRMIRGEFPTLTVLVSCDLTAQHMTCVPALVRAGADEIVLRGVDDLRSVFRRVLLQGTAARAATEAFAALRALVPHALEPVLAYCLAHAVRPLTVGKMAHDLGVHRKTLCNRAAAGGLPAPSILISWCRLYHAAWLLDDPGRSVERTALLLGFGSGTALRNMLRRYTGLRPTELCRRGGHRVVLGLLEKRLVRGVDSRASFHQLPIGESTVP